MKVSLLLTEDGQKLFYSEEPPPAPGNEATAHPGLRGWFDRKAHALRHAWTHSENKVAANLRHVWDWLQRRTDADEPQLVRLRTAGSIEVFHPASIPADEVRALWSSYLARRRRRHLPWLVVNTLVSPLTVVLAPLPGPNVVGYWFAYRAIRNLLAVLGLRRAIKGESPLSFHPVEALDRRVGPGNTGGFDSHGRDEGLDDFLERSGVTSAAEREAIAAH